MMRSAPTSVSRSNETVVMAAGYCGAWPPICQLAIWTGSSPSLWPAINQARKASIYAMAFTTTPSTRSLLVPLIAIILGTFMVILDNTVVNVALPTLGRVLNTDLAVLQWVITAYMLAQAAVIPLSGWLSDRFGAKRVYLTSLILFTIGSAVCGLAANGEMLIATRVIQGLGGGMIMPIGMAVLYRLTPPERRGAILGMFGIPI